jgi:hypothetical protein
MAVGCTMLCILLSVTYFWIAMSARLGLGASRAILTGKQPRASGGSSVILTGRSDILGGTGLLGGIVTSSNVYTSHQTGIAVIALSAWSLITHVIHVPNGSRGHGEPPAHGHTCRSTRSGGVHVRQYLLLHDTLRGLSTKEKDQEHAIVIYVPALPPRTSLWASPVAPVSSERYRR